MKHLIATASLLALVCGFNTHADQPITKEVVIAINDAFVPEVVDQNSDAKIVLIGMLGNSCYRWSKAEVTDTEPLVHQVRATATVTLNAMCLMVLVPYNKEVNLGRLTPGEHTLRFVSADDTFFERKMTVK